MKNYCPICQKEMTEYNKIKYIDYSCDDVYHHLSYRIKDNCFKQLRIRLANIINNATKDLILKIYYDENLSEIYLNDFSNNIVKINNIIYPDFSNLEKLKDKLKTILVFG